MESINCSNHRLITPALPQAQTPQALKQFYEKNAKLAPRIPAGTSAQFTHLLVHLLKRDAKDRIDFEAFFNHPFLAQAKQQPAPGTSEGVAVPGAGAGHQEPPQLPPSPAVTQVTNIFASVHIFKHRHCQGVVRPSSSPSLQAATLTNEKMETSESGASPAPRPGPKQLQSPGSSPDTDQDSDFVLVPNSLAGDSSRNKNMHAGYAQYADIMMCSGGGNI